MRTSSGNDFQSANKIFNIFMNVYVHYIAKTRIVYSMIRRHCAVSFLVKSIDNERNIHDLRHSIYRYKTFR